MNYLISYPKSGNTWVRYCLEYLTDKRTMGYARSTEFEPSVLKHTRDLSPWLIKKHELRGIDNPQEDKIILIIRNYKEVLLRLKGENYDLINSQGNTGRFNYFKLINFYNGYKGKKHLVYYEDIISNLKKSIIGILNFLGEDVSDIKLNDFFNDIENHKIKSLEIYSDSKTKGKNVIFHSNKLSLDRKKEWDSYVENNYKKIFDKYLNRYKEDS